MAVVGGARAVLRTPRRAYAVPLAHHIATNIKSMEANGNRTCVDAQPAFAAELLQIRNQQPSSGIGELHAERDEFATDSHAPACQNSVVVAPHKRRAVEGDEQCRSAARIQVRAERAVLADDADQDQDERGKTQQVQEMAGLPMRDWRSPASAS